MATKQIRTPADLAIHGAASAFEALLHVGRPNLCNRDAFLARVGGISDNQWLTNNGPVVQTFEDRIARHLGFKHGVAMCSDAIGKEAAPSKLKPGLENLSRMIGHGSARQHAAQFFIPPEVPVIASLRQPHNNAKNQDAPENSGNLGTDPVFA